VAPPSATPYKSVLYQYAVVFTTTVLANPTNEACGMTSAGAVVRVKESMMPRPEENITAYNVSSHTI
jgi:hypothetical protein